MMTLTESFNSLKSYISGYISASFTTAAITAGTPVQLDMTNLVAVFAKNFEVVASGIKYTGEANIKTQGVTAISMTGNTNNTIAKFYRGKNNVIDLTTELKRKSQVAGDLGALPITGGGSIETGDIINFYVDSSLGGTITVENFNFTIENITL